MNLKYLAECIVQAVTNIDSDDAVVIIEGLLKHSVYDPAQAVAKLEMMVQSNGKSTMITLPLSSGGEATLRISDINRVWSDGHNANASISIKSSEKDGLITCSKPVSFVIGLMREAGCEVYADRPINLAKV